MIYLISKWISKIRNHSTSTELSFEGFSVLTSIGRFIGFPFYQVMKRNSYLNDNILPLYSIVNKTFTRNKSFIFLTFFFPMIFVIILGNVISQDPKMVVFAIGTYIPLVVGIQVLSSSMISYKRSSLLKRIGATKIKSPMLMISFISYYSFCTFLSIIMNVGIGVAIFHNKANFNLSEIAWGYYFLAIILQMILAFGIGITVSAFVKQETTAIAICLLIIIPGAFLAGQFIPITSINKVDAMRYIGWFFPQKGPTMLGSIAVTGDNPFKFSSHYTYDPSAVSNLAFLRGLLNDPNFHGNKQEIQNLINQIAPNGQIPKIEFSTQWENTISIVTPLACSALLMFISAKFFRWTSR